MRVRNFGVFGVLGALGAVLAVGCVSVAPPAAPSPSQPSGTAAPSVVGPSSAPPSLPAVPTVPGVPSASPISVPTLPPLPTVELTLPPVTLPPLPTLPPAQTLSPLPTLPTQSVPPDASPTPYGGFAGTSTLLFSDTFVSSANGWAEGGTDEASVARAADGLGGLEFHLSGGPGIYVRTQKALGAGYAAVRFRAWTTFGEGAGFFGAHCRDSEENFIGGGVDTDGNYSLYRGSAGAFEMIGSPPAVPLTGTGPGDLVLVEVECAADGSGNVDVWLWVNTELVLHQSESGSPLGTIFEVGAHAQTVGETFDVKMSQAIGWVAGPAAIPTLPPVTLPPATGIEGHIPSAMLPDCEEVDSLYEEVIETWRCDPDANTTIYHMLFPDEDAAQAFFSPFGEEGSDCTNGEEDGHGTYTIGGVTAGEYTCGYDLGGALITWISPTLNIVSEIRNRDEDWDHVWSVWADAGPNP